MKSKLYAGVVIDRVHPSLDRIFHYSIPDDMIDRVEVGMRVLVPFGRGNKMTEGYVLHIDSTADISPEKIKPIEKILDPYPLLLPKFIPLINWMKQEYHCLTIEAVRCFIPPGLRVNVRARHKKVVYLQTEGEIDDYISAVEGRSRYMAEILRVLGQGDGIPLEELREMTGAPASSFKSLEKKGWIKIEEVEVYREIPDSAGFAAPSPSVLTAEQRRAVEAIERVLVLGCTSRFLLHGVTGSGKTEVYIRAVQKALKLRKQAIVLVPEISLTPQTVGRFRSRFGDRVAILHSGLSAGERFDEWRKIRRQEVDIVVGARSAVFAPFARLGLVIIDEMHEDSYKSDVRPRYRTLDVAEKRCELEGAVLVMGSATPSVEVYYQAANKKYITIEMKKRVDDRPLPPVEIVDMREELVSGNRTVFSRSLYLALKKVLARGQQAILFINQRGYARFVSCRSCGWVAKCRHCDISLTYHADTGLLKCHYCGWQCSYPSVCPACGSRYIKHFGIGTQRVEKQLAKFFPRARVVRMDMDTTSTRGAHQKILNAFGEGEYDILLGTQMIAKGLDFPNVTLVGVIAADSSLNLPEYKSSERTFQLITQVAGRAGRGPAGGKVIIQTYQPEHYAIRYAAKHDYEGFYREEIEIRRRFDYPPFSHIIKILVTGKMEESVIKLARSMEQWLKQQIGKEPLLKQGLIDAGAYPAPLEKINNKYRWQVIIRIRPDALFNRAYHRLVLECTDRFYNNRETIIVDFYPTSLL